MTKEEALKLAQLEAEAYRDSGNYTDFNWSQSWIRKWYNKSKNTSFSDLTFRTDREVFNNSVFKLAEEIYFRNTPLFKAMQEED